MLGLVSSRAGTNSTSITIFNATIQLQGFAGPEIITDLPVYGLLLLAEHLNRRLTEITHRSEKEILLF